jgi:NAD(P) transhydrogenase subunit alpha
MRSIVVLMMLSVVILLGLAIFRMEKATAAPKVGAASAGATTPAASIPVPNVGSVGSRAMVIVSSLTVFVLAIFIGFEVIGKVPPTLHTPLMSGSNAISGITVVGAIVIAGYKEFGLGSLSGTIAIVLAMINVVGGFAVTHRMLLMFKKR